MQIGQQMNTIRKVFRDIVSFTWAPLFPGQLSSRKPWCFPWPNPNIMQWHMWWRKVFGYVSSQSFITFQFLILSLCCATIKVLLPLFNLNRSLPVQSTSMSDIISFANTFPMAPSLQLGFLLKTWLLIFLWNHYLFLLSLNIVFPLVLSPFDSTPDGGVL